MGRLGKESSILYLSRYLLKINFTLDLYFACQNAEVYEPLMSHDNDMIERVRSLSGVLLMYSISIRLSNLNAAQRLTQYMFTQVKYYPHDRPNV